MNLYYKLKFQSFDVFYFSDLEPILKKAFGNKYQKFVGDSFNLDLEFIGPLRLLQKNRSQTVNRSHHVNKKSRDQFKLTTHSCLWILKTQIDPSLSMKKKKEIEEKLMMNLFKVLQEVKKNKGINMNISQTKSFLQVPEKNKALSL